MKTKRLKRYLLLSVLFFLPVVFLLLLYPAEHNYKPLDIRVDHVKELHNFRTDLEASVQLKDHISVIGFLGRQPLNQRTQVLNLKELIYDKFVGFKTFQLLLVAPEDVNPDDLDQLKNELAQYSELKYFHFILAPENEIHSIFNSLQTPYHLDNNLALEEVFIIDKDRKRRGRADDRNDSEKEKNKASYPLDGYNCLEVAELKNKMSEDVRILFTEYRQKRKGTFDSNARRANDLKTSNEN